MFSSENLRSHKNWMIDWRQLALEWIPLAIASPAANHGMPSGRPHGSNLVILQYILGTQYISTCELVLHRMEATSSPNVPLASQLTTICPMLMKHVCSRANSTVKMGKGLPHPVFLCEKSQRGICLVITEIGGITPEINVIKS